MRVAFVYKARLSFNWTAGTDKQRCSEVDFYQAKENKASHWSDFFEVTGCNYVDVKT